MAYEIIGTVHKIGATENIQTKSGSTFQRRSLTLMQRRYDQNTGEEFEPNYPTIDFSRNACGELDKYKPGDTVRVRFDLSGTRYNDRATGEEKYFTSLRGFRIELYVRQQNVPQAAQQPMLQPMPQNYAPVGVWQQAAPQYQQQGGYQQAAIQQQGYEDAPF